MQSIVLFFVTLWTESLILSLVVGMCNLILLISSVCLVDRYEETPGVCNAHKCSPCFPAKEK